MRSYRKHLSGEAAFKSFVPMPLSEIQVIHTEELDKLIMCIVSNIRKKTHKVIGQKLYIQMWKTKT